MSESIFNTINPNPVNLRNPNPSEFASAKSQAELKKAAEEFEAIFIGQLLKIMRETIQESGLEGGGLGKGIYTELFDQEIALNMARRGALGIGDIIYKSFTDNENVYSPESLETLLPNLKTSDSIPKNSGSIPKNSNELPASKVSSSGEAAQSPKSVEATPSSRGDSGAAQENLKLPLSDAAESAREISVPFLPVNAPVSSAFGMRKDPFTGTSRFHKGIDLAAPAGTPVVAALPGKVISAGYKSGYGNTVLVEHDGGLKTRYGHLASINVKVGDMVTSESTLGKVGSTGRSTGPHLHFEVIRDGVHINPAKMTVSKE